MLLNKTPHAIQHLVDNSLAQYANGRAFVLSEEPEKSKGMQLAFDLEMHKMKSNEEHYSWLVDKLKVLALDSDQWHSTVKNLELIDAHRVARADGKEPRKDISEPLRTNAEDFEQVVKRQKRAAIHNVAFRMARAVTGLFLIERAGGVDQMPAWLTAHAKMAMGLGKSGTETELFIQTSNLLREKNLPDTERRFSKVWHCKDEDLHFSYEGYDLPEPLSLFWQNFQLGRKKACDVVEREEEDTRREADSGK